VNGTFARNTITVGTMVRQQQPTLVNGLAVRPGTVQFYAENSEMCYRAWPNATWLAFVIPRERLLQFCLDQFDEVPDLPAAGIAHFDPPLAVVSRSLMAGLRELDRSLRSLSREENSARLGESVEHDLLARLSSAICRRPSVRRSYDRRRLHRCTEMLRDSMALVENDSQEVLDLQAMSKATGLSPRTLQRTFQAECGLCPQEWFRVERLNRARQDLLNAGPDASVTRAATRWGFFHLGRFAYYYRELFGESPNETLRWERRMQRRIE
jgi:AraC-like DNA-binding protein